MGTNLSPKLSIIVTAKSKECPKYRDFIQSVAAQSMPKKDYEVITVTEGDPESAKAIGLKRATGDIVGIFASDNFLDSPTFLEDCMLPFYQRTGIAASFPIKYSYMTKDNILNRYFSLMGVNDVIPFYLKKADKRPQTTYTSDNTAYWVVHANNVKTIGDNGTFVKRKLLLRADIENYFHIDVFQDLFNLGHREYAIINTSLWHRTGGNIFKFFWKRFKYADQFNTSKRRWVMVTKKDIPALICFILGTLLVIPRLTFSIVGFCLKPDIAWFLHWPVCMLTIITYGAMVVRRCFQSLFQRTT